MNVTVSMDSVLDFINSMSLSASNKEWLGRKLIEEAKVANKDVETVTDSPHTTEERIKRLSPRLQKLIGCVHISQEEVDNDERLAYILSR